MEIGGAESGFSDCRISEEFYTIKSGGKRPDRNTDYPIPWVSDAILYYDIQGKSAGQKADYPITGYPRNFILLNKEYFNKK